MSQQVQGAAFSHRYDSYFHLWNVPTSPFGFLLHQLLLLLGSRVVPVLRQTKKAVSIAAHNAAIHTALTRLAC